MEALVLGAVVFHCACQYGLATEGVSYRPIEFWCLSPRTIQIVLLE